MGITEQHRFICYHVSDDRKGTPIATGRTREQAQTIGITRMLTSCILDGGLQVQDRTADVDESVFTQLTQLLNTHFMYVDRDVRGGS